MRYIIRDILNLDYINSKIEYLKFGTNNVHLLCKLQAYQYIKDIFDKEDFIELFQSAIMFYSNYIHKGSELSIQYTNQLLGAYLLKIYRIYIVKIEEGSNVAHN